MLTATEFSELVARADRHAQRSPWSYRLRVALLAALGFSFVLGSVFIALAIGAGLIALAVASKSAVWLIKIIWIPFAFAWMLIRALWVRLEPPTGRPLTRTEARQLLEAIDDVQRQVGAPRLHRVLLTGDFNAAVTSVPRLGLLGWPRHYLLLGLPMLCVLSTAELRAVLAHEFGHLSRKHAVFSNWIYRLRSTWGRIQAEFEHRQGRVAGVFRQFLAWYAPYFNAYSFALARANEYEADAESVRIAGAQTAAQALATVHVRGEIVNRAVWSPLFHTVSESERPQGTPYANHVVQGRAASGDEAALLRAALDVPTGLDDTHPSLKDRLRAIGAPVQLGAADTPSAAVELLGTALPALCEEFDRGWRERVSEWWRQTHARQRDQASRLSALEEAAATRELTIAEHWERATATEQLHGARAAQARYRAILDRDATHAAAAFALGRILLAQGDPVGVEHVERVMAADPAALEPGSELLYQYFLRQGDLDRADRFLRNLAATNEARRQDAIARSQLETRDEFEPHRLDADGTGAITAVLARDPRVARAWLVRKRLSGTVTRTPHFILLVALRSFIVNVGAVLNEIADRCPVPGSLLVVTASSASRSVRRRIRRVAGAPVHQR
jgi:Zn-dependent protease with chaperone function